MARYYIAWHNTSHGIGFLKNILAAFAKHHKILPQNSNEEKILLNAVGQSEMERYFDENPDVKPVFDKVVYFYTDQKVINETTSFSFSTRTGFTDDPELSVELRDAWLEIRRWYYEDKYKNNPFSDNKGLLAEVRKKLIEISANNSEKIPEEFNQKLWRFIHYFPIEDQIEWLKSESNLPQKIKNALLFVNMSRYGVRSLRERYSDVCDSLLRWTDKHIKSEDEVYINIGYGSYVVQVAFYVMAEAGIFPRKTFFLNCYDSKNDDKNLRFKDFVVAQVPVRLFSGMRRQVESIFKNTKSPARKLADELLTFYLNKIETAFTILILGERGVGKTRLVRTIASKTKGQKEIVYVNCASFDDDNKAESELFGYEKGAFTGANTDKKGLFLEARNKILFLDEVHHLSKFVQAKLMTALQTDDNGNFKVRRMGSNETIDVKCTVIFASNRTIEQLRRELLPDFYDRISQLVVEIPPLRETREDRKADWEATWKHLFKNDNPKKDNREAEVRNSFDSEVPNSSDLIEWLEGEDLPGNFRDLEKIALAYKMYMDFPETIKSQLEQKSALDYVRDQYRKYHGFHASSSLPSFELDLRLAPKVLEKNFLRFMAQELVKKYGSPEKVEKECKQLFGDDGVTAKTVRNWLGDS